MKQYELVLKNEKRKSYQSITWMIIISNIALLIVLALKGIFSREEVLITIIMVALVIGITLYAKGRYGKIETSIIFIILMTTWITTGFWWVAVINLLFEIFQMIALRTLIVKIKSEDILYPSFPQKIIHWKELSNLVLKDGLLTIDFKNNTLIQQHVEDGSTTADEKEFNEFCRLQLNK